MDLALSSNDSDARDFDLLGHIESIPRIERPAHIVMATSCCNCRKDGIVEASKPARSRLTFPRANKPKKEEELMFDDYVDDEGTEVAGDHA